MVDTTISIGFIGRFKPLHNGGATFLEEACKKYDSVVIGIGSSNKYNIRNPFTAPESKDMIDCFLRDKFSNYRVEFIPDFAQIPEFANGEKWRDYAFERFGSLNLFASSNDFVRNLMKDKYELIFPHDIIPEEKRVKVKSSDVRIEMARFGEWEKLVPEKVVEYLETKKLVDRFRNQFGLQTLALLENENYLVENVESEKLHSQEAI